MDSGNLIGRQAEIAAATSALESGGGVIIVGDAGVGKTSLARATLDALVARHGTPTLRMTAPAVDPPVPYGVFAPFIPIFGARSGHRPDPLVLLQTIRAALLVRSDRPLVLGLDEAHHLDDHSAALVFQLVAAGEAKVVMTLTSTEPAPAGLRMLWKEELVERLDLAPLGRPDCDLLAEHLLAGHTPPNRSALPDGYLLSGYPGPQVAVAAVAHLGGEVTEALWRTSRGHPLYLRELVRAAFGAGRLVESGGMWRLNGDLCVGARLTELVAERLDRLDPDQAATLETVALAEPVPMGVLLRLVDAQDVTALQESGLLIVDRAGGGTGGPGPGAVVRIRHPVHAESVRASIPDLRARTLGLALADAFEAEILPGCDLLRVVTWRLDGGQLPPAEQLIGAAIDAGDRNDWTLSVRLAEAALTAGGGPEAALALADAQRALGRFTDALRVLGAAGPAGEDQAARMAVLEAAILSSGLERPDDADATLRLARDRLGNPSNRAWMDAVRAGLMSDAGRPHDALALAGPLLEDAGLSGRAEAAARAALAMAMAWTGRPEEAIGLVDDPLHRITVAGTGCPAAGWADSARALAYLLSGRISALDTLFCARYDRAVRLRDAPTQSRAATALGWAALTRGRLDEAGRRFREATTMMGAPHAGNRAHALLGMAEMLAQTGDADGARLALGEALPAAESAALLMLRWEISAAWVDAAGGSTRDALDRLGRAAEQSRRQGLVAYEMLALHAAVRLGSAAPLERLQALAGWVEGPLVQLMAAHARALSDPAGGPEALDRASELYAASELNLFAAEAAAQASRAHGLAGRDRRATGSAARAHFYLITDPDGPRPLALGPAPVPPGLTRREGEVARMAASGLSSAAIAGRLCLSVRTVETHLARVYVKLGIGGRAELGPALRAGARTRAG